MASYTASVFAMLGSTMLVAQIPGLVEMGSSSSVMRPILPVEPSLPISNDIDDRLLDCLSSNLNETQNCDNSILAEEIRIPTDKGQTFVPWQDGPELLGWSHALQRFFLEDSISNHFVPISGF